MSRRPRDLAAERATGWREVEVQGRSWLEVCADEEPLMAGSRRPKCIGERQVPTRLPTFRSGASGHHTAMTLNRSQSSPTCRALSFSALSLTSPLRSKIAYAKPNWHAMLTQGPDANRVDA